MSGSDRVPVLEMRGIRKEFPGVVALDNVDLTLEAGDVHMLLGENGAGKSTLMKILGGAYTKDAGDIRLNGQLVDIGSPRAARDLGIRVIYQELNLVPHLSVGENIFLGELPRRWGGVVDWRTLADRTSSLLQDLGVTLDPRAPVGRLGLAQRQMVEIAKALAPASAKAEGGQAGDAAILSLARLLAPPLCADQLFQLVQELELAPRPGRVVRSLLGHAPTLPPVSRHAEPGWARGHGSDNTLSAPLFGPSESHV